MQHIHNYYLNETDNTIVEGSELTIMFWAKFDVDGQVGFVHGASDTNLGYGWHFFNDKLQFKCLKEIYKQNFSMSGNNINFINFSNENMLNTANKLVHFGWKEEAIPISKSKKSFIAMLFDKIFG